ncbi:hypothetical protein NUW58_g995 [Xylaria curta]|uniref:Uncharacterized protein n=1 Tax=Xylaria curta TaxID=42375 RepID=A0ACC1PPQ1_9PEZI|nr:hypothetical protein NUW58_g995 [Xylaria curta]
MRPSSPAFRFVEGLILLQSAAQAIEPPRQPHQPTGNGDKILTWNETYVNNGQFRASSIAVSWLSGGEDGQYIYQADDGALILENFVTGESSTFVSADVIPDGLWEYWIHSDLSKVLFATNYTKQYRHSYFADYSVLDLTSGKVTPLVDDQVGDIQYAEFAPVGDAIAFVRGNNLFVKLNGTISQITDDGSPDQFNGVPDWVYEEEIFGGRSALWWSPDGQKLAYLGFNETGVETFTVPLFMDNQKIAPVYPVNLDLRYPKVSSKNPTVSLTLLSVGSNNKVALPLDAFDKDDLIIGELAWITESHDSFIYVAFNRVQDLSKHVRVDVSDDAVTTEVVRERDGTDGWIDITLAIQYVGPLNGSSTAYYVDLSDESGWLHLYLHAADGSSSKALTSGEWEVVSILHVDATRELIYFTSTEHDSTERHVYSVSYATGEKKALVDDTVTATWGASFSSGGGYYILSYRGPDVPYQELYAINDTTTPLRTVTSNENVWNKLQEYNLPNTTYFKLEHPSGYTVDVKQVLPPNFDPEKKYPALFTPYGGPGAQQVTTAYAAPNWNAYITSDPELEYITYTVDNRGSGYQGRAYRSLVTSHLGEFEAEDQIWAAQELSSRHSFIDTNHIAIFGWSYGGFLAAKVVETNTNVFSLALIRGRP